MISVFVYVCLGVEKITKMIYKDYKVPTNYHFFDYQTIVISIEQIRLTRHPCHFQCFVVAVLEKLHVERRLR